jgi:hypothetical protein
MLIPPLFVRANLPRPPSAPYCNAPPREYCGSMHRFISWRTNILKARTRQEVLGVIRDYVACVLPSESSKLPQASQAAIADAASDIAGAAVTLLRDELRFSGDEETAELMREMAQTFTAASARLAQIESREVAFVLEDPQPAID